jgi:hypothetical protein
MAGQPFIFSLKARFVKFFNKCMLCENCGVKIVVILCHAQETIISFY